MHSDKLIKIMHGTKDSLWQVLVNSSCLNSDYQKLTSQLLALNKRYQSVFRIQ